MCFKISPTASVDVYIYIHHMHLQLLALDSPPRHRRGVEFHRDFSRSAARFSHDAEGARYDVLFLKAAEPIKQSSCYLWGLSGTTLRDDVHHPQLLDSPPNIITILRIHHYTQHLLSFFTRLD
jgi:hypothetical protein